MRREDDVLEGEETLLHLRLALVHVERRACDRARLERGHERALVDDRPPRGVDEHGRRLHRRERGRVDQVARLVRERHVDADHVRVAKEGVEVVAAAGEARLRAERLGEAGGLAADAAGADDEQPLAVQPAPEHELERELPRRAPADEAVALGDPPEEREHQADRELGRRARQHVGRVRDEDAALRGRVEVDVVDADRVVRDDAELRPGAVEERPVDARRQHRDDPVRALRRVGELEGVDEGALDLDRHRGGDVHPRPAHSAAVCSGSRRRGRCPAE